MTPKKTSTNGTKNATTTSENPSSATTQESPAVPQPPVSVRTVFHLSDEVIGMVRELVQLSLLTGTNIVDHLRALVVEVDPNDGRKVTTCPEYVQAYNQMVEKLNSEAEQKMMEMQKKLAGEESPAGN